MPQTQPKTNDAKPINLTPLAVALSQPGSCGPRATTFCTQIGILSSKVMELRQQEIPLSTVMSSEVDPSLKELRDAIVLQAYDTPAFSTAENQKRAIDGYRNQQEIECFKAFKK